MSDKELDIQISIEQEIPDIQLSISENNPEIEFTVESGGDTHFPVGSLYATEDSTDNPAVTLGVGSWSLIPPANTVNQLASQSENFVTTGEIYIWRRTA